MLPTSPLPGLTFVWDDGGRLRAGYQGQANDCAARSIAIAAQLPYRQVYDRINELARYERPRLFLRGSNAERGVHIETMDRFLLGDLGWVAYQPPGKVTLEQLPLGRLVVRVGRHYTAITHWVVRDIYNLAHYQHAVSKFWVASKSWC